MLCKVNKNLEAKHRDELPQHACVELVYRPASGVPKLRERLMQDYIHSALESVLRRDQMPRTLLQIVIQDTKGSHFNFSTPVDTADAINTACMSCVEAGVEMSGLICACAIGIGLDNKKINLQEVDRQLEFKSTHLVALKFVDGEHKIVLCESRGECTNEDIIDVLKLGIKYTTQTYEEMREKLST